MLRRCCSNLLKIPSQKRKCNVLLRGRTEGRELGRKCSALLVTDMPKKVPYTVHSSFLCKGSLQFLTFLSKVLKENEI